MKNKKLIALGLVSTLFIVSCGKKVEQTTNTWTTSTWVVSTGTVASTGTTVSTWTVSSTENNSWAVVAPVNPDVEVTKNGDSSVLTNKKAGYELTFNVNEDLKEQSQQGIDLFLVSKSGNMFSSVTSTFQENTLEEYLNKGIEEMKAQIPDIKKEAVEINGVKWFKLAYGVDQISFEQYLFEGKNKTAILLSKTVVDSKGENFDSIVKSFKLGN